MLSIIFYVLSKDFEGLNAFRRVFKTKQLQLLFLFSFSFAFLHAQNPLTDYVWSSEDTNISSAVVQGVDPFGNQSNLLEITSDGNWRGFAINNISINPSLTYRFSFWVKANAILPNYTFTGKVTSTTGIINNNATITNDFYLQSGWALPGANNWYLYVGYINGTGDSNTYTGVVYDTAGQITNLGTNNYIFSGNSTTLSFGASSNSSDNNTKIIYFDPRIQVVSNGNNSVDDLLGANSTPSSNTTTTSIWSETGDNATYLGNVGIGTNTPAAKLEINKAGTIGGDWNPANSFLTLSDTSGANMILDPNEIYGSTTLHIGSNSGDVVKFRSLEGNGIQERMIIKGNGNVGIGTSSPDEKLAVNGTVHAKEVRVDLTNWPDYVFQEDYKLKTMQELREYLNKNGHLPNIPSAKEVEEQGVELGEMNRLLLEKIEELILYILQQNDYQQSLEKRIVELEKIKN